MNTTARLILEASTGILGPDAQILAEEWSKMAALNEELKQALIGLDEAYCRAGTRLNAAERTEDRLRLVTARAVLAKVADE